MSWLGCGAMCAGPRKPVSDSLAQPMRPPIATKPQLEPPSPIRKPQPDPTNPTNSQAAVGAAAPGGEESPKGGLSRLKQLREQAADLKKQAAEKASSAKTAALQKGNALKAKLRKSDAPVDVPLDPHDPSRKEVLLVTQAFANWLTGKGGVQAKQKEPDEHVYQTAMKTVEMGADVDLVMDHEKAMMGYKNLIIWGDIENRERAKAMMRKLASGCQEDSLARSVDAWGDVGGNIEKRRKAMLQEMAPDYKEGASLGRREDAWLDMAAMTNVDQENVFESTAVSSYKHGDSREFTSLEAHADVGEMVSVTNLRRTLMHSPEKLKAVEPPPGQAVVWLHSERCQIPSPDEKKRTSAAHEGDALEFHPSDRPTASQSSDPPGIQGCGSVLSAAAVAESIKQFSECVEQLQELEELDADEEAEKAKEPAATAAAKLADSRRKIQSNFHREHQAEEVAAILERIASIPATPEGIEASGVLVQFSHDFLSKHPDSEVASAVRSLKQSWREFFLVYSSVESANVFDDTLNDFHTHNTHKALQEQPALWREDRYTPKWGLTLLRVKEHLTDDSAEHEEMLRVAVALRMFPFFGDVHTRRPGFVVFSVVNSKEFCQHMVDDGIAQMQQLREDHEQAPNNVVCLRVGVPSQNDRFLDALRGALGRT